MAFVLAEVAEHAILRFGLLPARLRQEQGKKCAALFAQQN
jgi:hypothetical protein